MALHSQRHHSESGPQPLQFQEVAAFLALEGRWVPKHLVPRFTRMVRALDSEYIEMALAKSKAQTKT